MSVSYPFTISTDFPNGKVSVKVLQDQILASAIADSYQKITCASDTCTITFSTALTSTGEDILDALVAAHQGAPYSPLPITCHDEDEEEASSLDPLDKVVLTMGLAPGEYNIDWSCDLMSSSTSKEIFINVAYNGTIIRQSKQAVRIDGFTPFYGIAPLSVTLATAGSWTIKLQYGCTVEGMSAHIRDGFLKISKREE